MFWKLLGYPPQPIVRCEGYGMVSEARDLARKRQLPNSDHRAAIAELTDQVQEKAAARNGLI